MGKTKAQRSTTKTKANRRITKASTSTLSPVRSSTECAPVLFDIPGFSLLEVRLVRCPDRVLGAGPACLATQLPVSRKYPSIGWGVRRLQQRNL
jgi:hypothetical protein